jgi:hypothetical protein
MFVHTVASYTAYYWTDFVQNYNRYAPKFVKFIKFWILLGYFKSINELSPLTDIDETGVKPQISGSRKMEK